MQDKKQFNQWLNPAIKEAIFKKIEKNKNPRSVKPEYENLLKLVGLLAYLKLQPTRLRAIFTSTFQLDTTRRYLGDRVEKLNFLPGCFFLKGVELFLRRQVYNEYWELVKGKQGDYKVQTRALRELMDLH